MAATNPGDGSRAHRPYLESRRTTVVSRPSSQGLKPVSRLRGTAPKNASLNLSQFVEGRRGWTWAREGREEAHVFAGDKPCPGEEIHRASARFDAATKCEKWSELVMGRTSNAKSRLIAMAMARMYVRGDEAVGVHESSTPAGVYPCGFYHFFPSKQGRGVARFPTYAA